MRKNIIPEALYAPDGGGSPGGVDVKMLESAIAELVPGLKKVREDVKQYGEELGKEIKATGAATKETKERLDKALTEHAEFSGRLTQVEQMLVGLRANGGTKPRTVGQIVADDDAFKKFAGTRQ